MPPGQFSYEFDVRLEMFHQIFMVRKGSKLILIQQEATDLKSKFGFFLLEEIFLSVFHQPYNIPRLAILNVSYSKLFLHEYINLKYQTMVSPRFLKSYG